MKNFNGYGNIAFLLLIFVIFSTIYFSALSFADTAGNSSFTADYEITGFATEAQINSTNYNASISGALISDVTNNSNFTVYFGMLPGAVETTTTTPATTTTTAAGGIGGTVAYSTSDDRVSGILVDPGANVSLKAFTGVPITLINFIANRTISNGAISIKKVNSENLTIAKTKETANLYLEITTNIPALAVKDLKIRFYVPKTWMDSSKAESSQIALQRYSGGAWARLPTVMISTDANNYYFESESPGFSFFAITALPPGETAPLTTATTATTTTGEVTTTTTPAESTTTTAPSKKPAAKNILEIIGDLLKSLFDAIKKLIETIFGKK